ncbi:hypothetical protein GCM10010218_12250 [Streptomyces mashuensis]|uniref:Uncharacterized protein n=1 Tax=Streptomyces mashuensis TaxID=33904 RepID=A0A919B0A6_9ACTN|nr:hypothetical protein [Streptomyces mashuensis]GHF32737.1 hypothetical protein GCM10010218_12250 [Streptomyces mashuensis]
MSLTGESPPEPPPPPPNAPFWSRVKFYWFTAGLALVLVALITALLKAGPFDQTPSPAPPVPVPGPATTAPAPPPSPDTRNDPTPARAPAARITNIRGENVTTTAVRVQLDVGMTGMKGHTCTVMWYVYDDTSKQPLGGVSDFNSPVITSDATTWNPTFIVIHPNVHWQIRVGLYDEAKNTLDVQNSAFTFTQ